MVMMVGGGPGRRLGLVVGLSGVSCGGKTTVSKLLRETFPWASVVHQDAYFHPNEPKYHVLVPQLNHFNWDLKSALDLKKMERHLEMITASKASTNSAIKHNKLVAEQARFFPNEHFVSENRPSDSTIRQISEKFSSIPLTFIEGHIIFSHQPFYDLCNLRYFFTLDKEECLRRRQLRVYDPPNPPGYFELCGWPLYAERLKEVQKLKEIRYFDAKTVPLRRIYQLISADLTTQLDNLINSNSEMDMDVANGLESDKNRNQDAPHQHQHRSETIRPASRPMQMQVDHGL